MIPPNRVTRRAERSLVAGQRDDTVVDAGVDDPIADRVERPGYSLILMDREPHGTVDDGRRSFQRGEIVRIPVPRSIADGALTTHLGEHNFPIIRAGVAEIVTVPDAMLVETMRFFVERMKIDGTRLVVPDFTDLLESLPWKKLA